MAKDINYRDLSTNKDFLKRHLGPRDNEIKKMLDYLDFENLDSMVEKIIPKNILDKNRLENILPEGIDENTSIANLKYLARKNKSIRSYIGQGYYNSNTPEVVIRNVLENPGWYTAYTPYQAEISQGRLEAIANFQTLICDMTGLDFANASLLDEGTAAAEAMTLCYRSSKNKKSNNFFVSNRCHIQTIDLIKNRAEHLGINVIVGDENSDILKNEGSDFFGAIFQYPATDGEVFDYSEIIESLHSKKTLVVLACDLLALSLLKTPGELNADIAVGSSQRFGVPMCFGGPHAGFMSVKKILIRSMPGRIIGVSVDRHGAKAYRMSLQTREQHIRREKATSNICTAQALLAIMASFYAVYHGAKGIKKIAIRVNCFTKFFVDNLNASSHKVLNKNYFDTISIKCSSSSDEIIKEALSAGYNLRKVNDKDVSISFDETTKVEDIQKLLNVFGVSIKTENFSKSCFYYGLDENLLRNSEFLTHPVFNKYHSETAMMRYMRYLVNKDIALDRSMIPLGSCTMKLNAASEMKPITFSGFANIHPFVPKNQVLGYKNLIEELEDLLCKITGYDAVSLQPNAGSQGEYAGLLAIKAYHKSKGEERRDVCIIPVSAHGTNPASSKLAGLKIVSVNCDEFGNIDIDDLKTKAELHKENLSCIMITYPSTHGVFESNVTEVCEIIHSNGGQVYIDGANLNAQVGLAYPGRYGGDVSHLNLHKTFCIPHGGGGPGIGPIGVKSHLAKFLPGHSIVDNSRGAKNAVSSAPWGSAGILPITYSYIKLMGGYGLKNATEIAILSANYITKKLEEYYPVLYRGETGYVAHECLIDIREIEKETGISNEDIAKRLIDYGFHAPTMSFPVPGTLMIEPTESEPLEELDRFIEAMISIKNEINEVKNEKYSKEDNVLVNAPHTQKEICSSDWKHNYTREKAAFPVKNLQENKIWPSVARVDNVYGDRNLFCKTIEN